MLPPRQLIKKSGISGGSVVVVGASVVVVVVVVGIMVVVVAYFAHIMVTNVTISYETKSVCH